MGTGLSPEMWAVIKSGLTFMGGFFTAIFAKPIGDWIVRPRLRVDLLDGAESIAFTPASDDSGKFVDHRCYLRLRLTNKSGSLARSVQCFLVKIELKPEYENEFGPAPYVDTQELPWASRATEGYKPIPIPRGVSMYVDVFFTSVRNPLAFSICTKYKPIREVAIGFIPGVWKFTVLVACENATPQPFTFEVDWKNSWNDFVARAGRLRVSALECYKTTGSAFKPRPKSESDQSPGVQLDG